MTDEQENCDVELKIVNRNREYTVSKKFICSSVPYFEKMFSCDLLESKENKVELDFDEHVFDAILDWIHSGSFFMQMDYVMSFYEAADYLMINDTIFEPCRSYFHENFTIEHLPVVLKQVSKVSKLISSGAIDNILCRHFLKIANTKVFLNYPVETVEAILKLDLMVHSEYQIFESIMKWVDENVIFREALFPQLLNYVRWSFMDPVDISEIMKHNELIKTLFNFDRFIESNGDCGFNRCKQSFFVSMHQRDYTKTLRIKVLDNKLFCLSIGDFTHDNFMSLEFFHGEHISDILLDSGTKGIRIDWIKKTYRWLDFKVAGNTYYNKLRKFIVEVWIYHNTNCYLEDKDAHLPDLIASKESLILESNGKFIVIGKTEDEKWFGMFPAEHESWFDYEYHEHSFKVTVLENVVYILTKDLEFIQFNYETRTFYKSEAFKEKGWNFKDLILTSHQTNDDKVILINKSSRKLHYYCINQKKWIEKYQVMNLNFRSNILNVSVDGLIAFTSTFLPIKNIKPLYRQCFD